MRIQRIRVPLGFLFAGLFVFFSKPTLSWLLPGLVIAAAGLAIRTWAAGHLEKWTGLAVSGPYKWTRNPLYLGSLILGFGLSLAAAQPLLLVLFVVLFFSVYLPVMHREEEELRAAYGELFEAYRERVPLLLPRIRLPAGLPGARTDKEPNRFRWRRVMDNREYRAALGFVLISCFLWLKMAWL